MRLVQIATAAKFWPFLHGQIQYLKERGLDVHLVSSGGPQLDELAAAAGVRAWRVPMSRGMTPFCDLRSLWRLARLLRQLRPDLVHAHTPKAGLLGMLAARAARTPARVYTLHGLVWQSRRGWRRRLLVALDRLACALADRVFAVSPSVGRSAIEARLAEPGKILVAGGGSADGLDLERFDPAAVPVDALAELRRRYRIPEGAPVVGFAGRLAPDKGIAELERAWTLLRGRFPALHLLIVGETEAEHPLPAGLEARLRLDRRVRMQGWTSDMPAHYRLMDVCVLPSRREGLPYAAIEAAAMERPVAGFAVDGVVDAVENGVTGVLVEPGDARALAEAVAALIESPERAARLGRQGRRRARRLYGAEAVRQTIFQQYLSLVHAAPRLLWWKRPADLAMAAALLAALAPLVALVALAVWIDLGRPILYRQPRPGLGERRFEVLKFRTMREAAAGAADHSRLTCLGRLLRRLSLDELPQLVNILRGEMSFIGPRPLLERYLVFYTPEEHRRHLVRPGLSGWAQIHGRNDLAWTRRLALDVWYVDHASWKLDAQIAARTVWKLITHQGARPDPASTMADLDQERRPKAEAPGVALGAVR